MATAVPVKMEDVATIKPDPDGTQQTQFMDEDDDFEDTGELELPSQPQSVWLLRVPRALFEKWNSINPEQEFCIGKLRRGKSTGKMSMVLDPNLAMHHNIERDYDVNTLPAPKERNTYIFSEKDLPGFKKGTKNLKKGSQGEDTLGPNKAGVDKNKRFQQYRRAIPKQTRLGHVITKEFGCVAQENDTTRAVRRQRQLVEDKNRLETQLDMTNQYAPELQALTSMNRKRDNPASMVSRKQAKPKPQENKAARMPRNELLDSIFQCFGEYNYWPMRSLRERLHQPEAYLKEVLESIAELVRSGPFNGTYRLRDDARKEAFNLDVKDEIAPEESDLEGLSGGDDLDDDPSDLRDD